MLPFTRLAILDLPAGEWDARSPGARKEYLQSWEAGVLARGGDACWLRVADFSSERVTEMVETLRLPLILPAVHPFPQAWGWHFRSTDPWTPLPGKPCGRACHSGQEVMQARETGFAWAVLSPIFPTETHPGAPALGMDTLAAVCLSCPDFPVVALGGLDAARGAACVYAGAAAWAGIRCYR